MSERNVSSWLLLFGLGVAWAVVLVPDMIRRNVASRRSDTIGQFARNLGSLQQSAPVGVGRSNLVHFPNRLAEPMAEPRPLERVPQPVRSAAPAERGQRRSPVQQRRQDVLTALVAAAVLSFLGSISIGGALIAVNAVIDVAFVLYLGALLLVTRREKLRSQVGVLYQAPHQFSAAQFGRPMPAYVERQRVAR
ncbi:MAG TPA: hypothetical protein PLV93_05670 [Microthrixaceae bacterium]|nr:hypothetical protein [Microthrixaceae bacterium]HNI34866.1 hypothetical protein [Microthrixaceae bacterium]